MKRDAELGIFFFYAGVALFIIFAIHSSSSFFRILFLVYLIFIILFYFSDSFAEIFEKIFTSIFSKNTSNSENLKKLNFAKFFWVRKAFYIFVSEMIKVDDSDKDEKIERFANFLEKEYGEKLKNEGIKNLEIFSKTNFNVAKECKKCFRLPHSEKIRILYQLFRIAAADKQFSDKEDEFLRFISKHLGILKVNFEKIRKMFVKPTENFNENSQTFTEINKNSQILYACEILNVSESASFEEIKHSYYRLAQTYHPDKYEHLGEEAILRARQMFDKIAVAYEILKNKN